MASTSVKEIVEMVNDAYRKGYLDGVNDRQAAPQQSVAPASPLADLPPDALSVMLGNLGAFDGTAQEPVEQTIRRTRNG